MRGTLPTTSAWSTVRRCGGRSGRRARTPPARVDRQGARRSRAGHRRRCAHDDEGIGHVVEWVTQHDVDLATCITEIAADHKLDADPASVCEVELGLDTARSTTIAPVWAALLTGSAESQGRGTPGDEIRDATGRVLNSWFGDAEVESDAPARGSTSRSMCRPRRLANGSPLPLPRAGTVVDESDALLAHRDRRPGRVNKEWSASTSLPRQGIEPPSPFWEDGRP